jgi:hypothetical protein
MTIELRSAFTHQVEPLRHPRLLALNLHRFERLRALIITTNVAGENELSLTESLIQQETSVICAIQSNWRGLDAIWIT